ncbi:MAG: hypothetical protein LBI94_07580 [Treponema sp.]|jgi:hypothetical protein|nr:hypothetical protein [Treponema sp.]
MGIYRPLGCLLLLLGVFPLLPAQESPAPEGEILEPETLIGLTLEGVYSRFGVPQEVYAVRGTDEWQDDVVLVYPQGDFYVYRDRVWQLGIPAVRGIRVGDNRRAVPLALGQNIQEGEDYFLLPISGRPWPIHLRVNIGNSGQVAEIFMYRSDF